MDYMFDLMFHHLDGWVMDAGNDRAWNGSEGPIICPISLVVVLR